MRASSVRKTYRGYMKTISSKYAAMMRTSTLPSASLRNRSITTDNSTSTSYAGRALRWFIDWLAATSRPNRTIGVENPIVIRAERVPCIPGLLHQSVHVLAHTHGIRVELPFFFTGWSLILRLRTSLPRFNDPFPDLPVVFTGRDSITRRPVKKCSVATHPACFRSALRGRSSSWYLGSCLT